MFRLDDSYDDYNYLSGDGNDTNSTETPQYEVGQYDSLEYIDVNATVKTCNYDHLGPGWFAYLLFLFVGMFIIPLLVNILISLSCIVLGIHETLYVLNRSWRIAT